MARTTTNILLSGMHGALGKQIVVKQYGDKTVITAYPDMSKVKPSKRQKTRRNIFLEAVANAQAINNDAVKKAAFKKK